MKHEWKKMEKEVYGANHIPSMVDVPTQKFIMIDGLGNPNEEDFSNRVSALYALAYAIKMNYKKGVHTKEITDFSVYPLEGIWKQKEDVELIKEKLEYTIMIRQPEVITEEMFEEALAQVKVKKPNPFYENIRFATCPAHTCVEILHIGSYDDEPSSFQKMDAFLQEKGKKRNMKYHREIYLSNANRTAKDKLKTILRYTIE